MSDLTPILANATEDELRVIANVLKRANAKPAVLVTIGGRRYVVAREDEHLFDRVPDGVVPTDRFDRHEHFGFNFFGGQWLRSYGKVDEMYRSLDTYEVTKVQRADRARVWGR